MGEGPEMRNAKLTIAAVAVTAALSGAASAETPKAPTGDPIAVPSGMEVRWLETLRDSQGPAGLTMRFRFVAPGLAKKKVSQEAIDKDMATLCNDYALPRIAKSGPQPAQIIIAVADRVFPFGEADESVKQYFEAYSIENGACVWELF